MPEPRPATGKDGGERSGAEAALAVQAGDRGGPGRPPHSGACSVEPEKP